jgi:hypothetical protein
MNKPEAFNYFAEMECVINTHEDANTDELYDVLMVQESLKSDVITYADMNYPHGFYHGPLTLFMLYTRLEHAAIHQYAHLMRYPDFHTYQGGLFSPVRTDKGGTGVRSSPFSLYAATRLISACIFADASKDASHTYASVAYLSTGNTHLLTCSSLPALKLYGAQNFGQDLRLPVLALRPFREMK